MEICFLIKCLETEIPYLLVECAADQSAERAADDADGLVDYVADLAGDLNAAALRRRDNECVRLLAGSGHCAAGDGETNLRLT